MLNNYRLHTKVCTGRRDRLDRDSRATEHGLPYLEPRSVQERRYNDQHRHSGIDMMTPAMVHHGLAAIFTDFNVTLSSIGSAYSALVPTDLERSGNFSHSHPGTGFVTIYDPATAHLRPDDRTLARNELGGFAQVQRPDEVGNPLRGPGTPQERFNTSAFVAAPALVLGNAARFPFHGPGLEDWDGALMRNLVLKERLKLQFRGEFYNTFNHTNFGAPNGAINTKAFGSIASAQAPRTIELALRTFF
jgi:hypothetical protein